MHLDIKAGAFKRPSTSRLKSSVEFHSTYNYDRCVIIYLSSIECVCVCVRARAYIYVYTHTYLYI